MSRVGKNPIVVPKGAEISIAADAISVKGPLGSLRQAVHPAVRVAQNDGQITFEAADESRVANAMSGTMRALVANMVNGVTKGFEKKLSLVGVGYRAQAQGDKLNLSLGYSHPVVYQLPSGVN